MEYKFVGDGMGVPGLPHEISDEEAEQMGVTELLKAALDNGSYEAVSEQKAEGSGQQSAVSDQPSASDAIPKELDEFETKVIDELFELPTETPPPAPPQIQEDTEFGEESKPPDEKRTSKKRKE